CGDRTSRSARSLGRSSGVVVALFQVPCRSRWPHRVRGPFQFVEEAGFVVDPAPLWPASGITDATIRRRTGKPIAAMLRRLISTSYRKIAPVHACADVAFSRRLQLSEEPSAES